MKKRKTSLQTISARLGSIDAKLTLLQKEEETVEKKVTQVAKEEQAIEKTLLAFGPLTLKKKHVFELIRASAGAFLGVGLGRGLLGLDTLARNLPWSNVLGILVFILAVSALLIYKDERSRFGKQGTAIIWRRLCVMYAVSLMIEYISLLLFNVSADSTGTLMKIMIVGSYTAMASAVTFSLTK